MMKVIVRTHLDYKRAKKIEDEWNALWNIIMEED